MIPHGVLFAGLALSYNLRVILLGVTALGIAAGVLGAFLLFRRRSLLADTLGHATLPGVVVAFMAAAQLLDGGKPFAVLLLGALISGWFAVRAVQFLRRRTPIREDAALAIVLTVFYGAGVVLLSVVQNLELRGSSGLELYVYGMVASMSRSDAWTLAAVSVAALGVVALLFKELRALSFDEGFVAARGLPHRWLDEVLMSACLVVTIAGLPTVGLLLVMALFIVPPATARLYADTLGGTLVVAGATGAVGAVAGALASARVDHLPAGAAMILATSALFFASLVAAPR
ncbi:MAG: metal ABC transporter permease, partial [Planctomycetota bacterium]